MSHLTRIGNPNVFATLPFDQIDGVAGGFYHDDFVQAITVADYVDATGGAAQLSDQNWRGSEIAANAAVANSLVLPGVADHAGILQLQTGGTTPGDGDGVAIQFGAAIGSVQDTLVLDDNGVYIACVARILDVSDQNFEFGFIGQQPVEANASAADVVSAVFDPADAANVSDQLFFAQANVAGTDTEVVGAGTYVESDWFLAEVGATDTSMNVRITTEDVTETLEIVATMPTVALRPVISTANIGAAEELLDVDLFHMRYLRRDSLVGQGSDWLGA